MTLKGANMTLEQIEEQIDRFASSDSSVLILGGNNGWNELIGREIHDKSARKNRPFIIVDCNNFPNSLLESELFGHEKGSFTGAYTRKIGFIEIANSGTLMIENIDKLSQGLQAKFYKLLKEKVIYRIGGEEPIRIDIRFISSSIDLESKVINQHFREDLYYMVNHLTLNTPKGKEGQIVSVTPHYESDLELFAVEKHHVLKTLREMDNNKTKAAAKLGITIKTLYNKLHMYGEFD